MVKIAFLFPGQGAQYVGMGRGLYERYTKAREIIDFADKILGNGLKRKIFYGPEEELQETLITQPAVFTVSVACLMAFREAGNSIFRAKLSPEVVAGHSLGEYTALVCAGVFDFSTGLQLVQKRAQFIHEASQETPGTMAAIIGLEKEKLQEVISEAKQGQVLEAVNFNSPSQVVIAGETQAVYRALTKSKEKGAKRAVPLKVSGAFHSPLMASAREKLAQELEKYKLKDPIIPVVTNYNAEFARSEGEIRKALINQIDSPVLWEDSIRQILGLGVSVFVELGPGKVLTGLLKRISEEAVGLNVEDVDTLNLTVRTLGELE